MTLAGFAIGFVVGTVFGITICALLSANKLTPEEKKAYEAEYRKRRGK